MDQGKIPTFICVAIPLLLLFLLWSTKNAKRMSNLFAGVLNAITILIPFILFLYSMQLFDKIIKIGTVIEKNPVLWGAYTFALGSIEFLIGQYKKLLPKTIESYEFKKSFSEIQDQWNLVKEDGNRRTKREFVNESLQNLKSSITCDDFYNNKLSDEDTKTFASIIGSLSQQYIRLSSSKKAFTNEIFVSLYIDLFTEYKCNVLDSINVSSTNSADLIIPEFVSNELTKIVIKHSEIVEYQYNTSVTSIKDFENNVGEELTGNKTKDFLRRIIISDEVDNPNNIDLNVFEKIIKWHHSSKMDLRFISKNTAQDKMKQYTGIRSLDFSIIKMKNEEEFVILWADKGTPQQIAGQKQEMYSVKFMFLRKPDADKLYTELWKDAKIGEIDNNNIVFKNIN